MLLLSFYFRINSSDFFLTPKITLNFYKNLIFFFFYLFSFYLISFNKHFISLLVFVQLKKQIYNKLFELHTNVARLCMCIWSLTMYIITIYYTYFFHWQKKKTKRQCIRQIYSKLLFKKKKTFDNTHESRTRIFLNNFLLIYITGWLFRYVPIFFFHTY